MRPRAGLLVCSLLVVFQNFALVSGCLRLPRAVKDSLRDLGLTAPAYGLGDAPSNTAEDAKQSHQGEESTFSARYDHVSIEHVLDTPRLLKNFHECAMDRGPCTSEFSELKRLIPDALRTECARCTEQQRMQAGKVLAYLLANRRDWWQELLDKFDPDGHFRQLYEYEKD